MWDGSLTVPRRSPKGASVTQHDECPEFSGVEYQNLLLWDMPSDASPEDLERLRCGIRKEPMASKALDRVLGDKKGSLCHEYYLLALVYATVIEARLTRASYEKRLMANTEKTLKSAKEFPARIERLATEIEKMNANPFFNSKRHDTLSLALRGYARFLAERVEFFNAMPSAGTQPGLHLSFTVRDWTGRFHDKEVLDLLTEAAAFLQKDREYDPQTLRHWRSDNQKAANKSLAKVERGRKSLKRSRHPVLKAR
jgi:hypothetical protein